MSMSETFQLTTKDHMILEVMRERNLARDPVISEILRRKLSHAIILFREDIPPDVVTLSSRVSYRVEDAPAETRIIAPDDMRGLVGLLLPITHPRALALIGLAEGQSMTIPTADGGTETVTAIQVAYQPEAARRERLGLSPPTDTRPPRHGPGFLRLVHDADARTDAPRDHRRAQASGGFDDPGPSAA